MPLPKTVDRIERQLLREQVYATLRDWIIHGVLQPNEKVRDVELAERLGVSRTPVREALRRLEDEGLVQTEANRWTRVAPLGLEDACELYPIIWTLEGLAIRMAGPVLTGADLDEMRQLNQRLARALQDKEPVEASAIDRDFHLVFIRRSGNQELIKILQGLKLKLRRLEAAYFGRCLVAERSVIEHEQIIAVLAAQDFDAAMRAVEANWRNSLARLMDEIQSSDA